MQAFCTLQPCESVHRSTHLALACVLTNSQWQSDKRNTCIGMHMVKGCSCLCIVQHESLGMLKEMLFALDLALHVGTPADKKAADRLQRRSPLLTLYCPCVKHSLTQAMQFTVRGGGGRGSLKTWVKSVTCALLRSCRLE